MLVAMVDTMVFDAVADDAELRALVDRALRERRLRLVTTHVQEDQLAAVPDRRRRRALQALAREVVPASVHVEGFSPPGQATPGAGEDFVAVRAGRTKHVADGVIADTTRARCDVLITEDRRLTRLAEERGLKVWSVDRLRRWLAGG